MNEVNNIINKTIKLDLNNINDIKVFIKYLEFSMQINNIELMKFFQNNLYYIGYNYNSIFKEKYNTKDELFDIIICQYLICTEYFIYNNPTKDDDLYNLNCKKFKNYCFQYSNYK